jgi:hypothetical protein
MWLKYVNQPRIGRMRNSRKINDVVLSVTLH